jgi:hypothetical protein
MRLREHAIYVKLVSRIDGVNEGVFLDTIRELEQVSGERFSEFHDLGGTRLPPKAIVPNEATPHQGYVGIGFHPTVRFSLTGTGVAKAVTFNAGLHPYSGVYVVQVDARFDAAFVDSNPAPVLSFARSLVEAWDPLTLHVHDVDDDAIQNIDNARLVELGYGVRVPVDLESRPGREASRGQFRFAVNWITYFGDETLELLGVKGRDDWPVPTERLPCGRWFKLGESTSDIGTAPFRQHQRELRGALDFDALIDEDRRSYSYWKRKP